MACASVLQMAGRATVSALWETAVDGHCAPPPSRRCTWRRAQGAPTQSLPLRSGGLCPPTQGLAFALARPLAPALWEEELFPLYVTVPNIFRDMQCSPGHIPRRSVGMGRTRGPWHFDGTQSRPRRHWLALGARWAAASRGAPGACWRPWGGRSRSSRSLGRAPRS